MEWEIELVHLFVSEGHNYVGRHEKGSLDHGIEDPDVIECVAGRGPASSTPIYSVGAPAGTRAATCRVRRPWWRSPAPGGAHRDTCRRGSHH